MDHFSMIVHTPYTEADTNEIPKEIRVKNKNYLLERVGENFKCKLNYYSCQIIDFKNYKNIKSERGFTRKDLSDKRAKYAFQYYFEVQDSMRYYLSIVYDKEGNVISDHQLPKVQKNGSFDSIITVCQAKQIAEDNKKYQGKLEGISLEYSSKHNSFVWEVKKTRIVKGKDVTIPFVLVCAQTGRVIGHRIELGRIVCILPDF